MVTTKKELEEFAREAFGGISFVTGNRGDLGIRFAKMCLPSHHRPLRCPTNQVTGPDLMEELAMAAGGVLYLEEADRFHQLCLGRVAVAWSKMHPEVRPALVIHFSKWNTSQGRSKEDAWQRIDETIRNVLRFACAAWEVDSYPPQVVDIDSILEPKNSKTDGRQK